MNMESSFASEKKDVEFAKFALTARNTSASNDKLSLWQAVKQNAKIVGYCLSLSNVILLYGYDLVIVGAVSALPQFQQQFGEHHDGRLIISSLWLAIWGVASPFGAMLGSGLGGFVQDRLGRRLSLLSACIVSAVAVALCYICDVPSSFDGRRSFFTGAKLLQGIAIGQLVVTTQTYMSEILPPKLRGPVLALFPISILLGQMIGAIVLNSQIRVPGHRSYRTCFASQWAFSATVLIASIFLPESPTWLVRKGNFEAALKAQKCLDRSHVDSLANIDHLRRSITAEEETTRSSTYLDCFRGTHLRRTMIVAIANLIPSLFGIVLLAKASYFLQVAGMKPSDSTLFLIVGIAIGLSANIASIWTLNACGRRLLVFVGMMLISLLWLGMGISAVFPGAFSVWWIAGSMMATTFVAGLSCWPASYVVSSETSSLHLRAKTQGVGWVTSTFSTCVFTIILPYIFNPDAGNLRGKTCFIFVGFCWIGALLAWVCIPEMKGRTAVEIDEMFYRRLPTRAFKAWRADEAPVGNVQ